MGIWLQLFKITTCSRWFQKEIFDIYKGQFLLINFRTFQFLLMLIQYTLNKKKANKLLAPELF